MEAAMAPDDPPLSSYVAEMLDTFTTRRLAQTRVLEQSRCLVIGAGAGTVARWLAGQVGADGEVVVTDPDPSQVPAEPGVTVLRHNLATDPLPEEGFDLIYARSVTVALPGRQELLAKLVTALAPGGAVVLDELETGYDPYLLNTSDPAARRLFLRYRRAFRAVLQQVGIDPWGRPTHQAMAEAGLVDVDTEWWSRSWRGGEPGCLLLRAFVTQLSAELTAAAMSPMELAEFRALLLDPRLVICGCPAVSTAGRKPAR
jgi:SAM-dependent methyltransferase